MGMSDCSENGRVGSSEEKDEAEGVRRESLTQGACDSCLGVHIQRQVSIYMYYFHRGGEGGWGGLAPSLAGFPLNDQQSPSVVMTTSTSLLPISSSAVARETRSASAW